jgi:hypothetical protein
MPQAISRIDFIARRLHGEHKPRQNRKLWVHRRMEMRLEEEEVDAPVVGKARVGDSYHVCRCGVLWLKEIEKRAGR